MLISVALCVFDGERFLGDQLASIAGQARLPDELIVLDDGSSDGSPALIDRFASEVRFPVRSFRNPTNLKTTGNFEKAIGLCRGDVIVTADQDDVWSPEKLAAIESEFERSPGVGLVFSDADVVDESGDPLGGKLWDSVGFSRASRRRLARGDSFATLLRRPVITGATMAFRAHLRDRILPIPPSWTHDHWIGLVSAAVSEVRPISRTLMQYRRHSRNQIGVNGVTGLERTKAAFDRPRGHHLAQAENFLELRSRLESLRPDLLDSIDRKVAHERARGSFPSSFFRRLPKVLRELATLGYSRYSGGTISFSRDLLSGG